LTCTGAACSGLALNASNPTKESKMLKLIQTKIFLSFLILPSISNAKDLPKFFKNVI
jgi:hypothetical protein